MWGGVEVEEHLSNLEIQEERGRLFPFGLMALGLGASPTAHSHCLEEWGKKGYLGYLSRWAKGILRVHVPSWGMRSR